MSGSDDKGGPLNKAPPKSKGNPAWRKGVSANPWGGGGNAIAMAFRRLAQQHGEDIIIKWVDEVMEKGPDWVKCSELLAAYGFGKPRQETEITVTAVTKTTVEERLEQLQNEELARLASGEDGQ